MGIPFLYPPGGEIIDGVNVELGEIFPLELRAEPYEISIDFRGKSYHVIFGRQCNGNFICIPRLHVGADLAGYDNLQWNKTSLERCGLPHDMAEMFAQCLDETRDYLSQE